MMTPDAEPITLNANRLYNLAQECSLGTITSSATPGTEIDGGFYFYLGQLDGSAALAAVFDQYRFLQVTLWFEPRANMVGTTGTVFPTSIGHLTSALDYDDVAATTASVLRQKQTCLTTMAYEKQMRTLTPHIALAAYSGAFTSFANARSAWIDSASLNVQHYSVKFAITECQFASTILYDVFARYVIQFRQVQ
jgi:hypothetical protein